MRGLWRRFEAWVTRDQPPVRGPARLERRRIYILPTRQGYAFAMLLFVLFLWSINYSNSMGFAFTFLLVAVAHNSMWQAHDNLLGLIVHAGGTEPVFVGQEARFTFRLENPNPKPRYGIALQWLDQPPQYVDLPANGAAIVTLRDSHPAARLAASRAGAGADPLSAGSVAVVELGGIRAGLPGLSGTARPAAAAGRAAERRGERFGRTRIGQ
jgi:hypothetical protein